MSEMEMILQELKNLHSEMGRKFDNIEKRLDNIEEQIEDIKEDCSITRSATNKNGEKLEELVALLNETNVISFKY